MDHQIRSKFIQFTNKCKNNLTSKEIKYLTNFEYQESNLYGTVDFLSDLPQRGEKDTTLVTFDITNMYTNINNVLGIEAIKFWLQENPNAFPERIPKQFILEALN